ncbi:MAG: amidohydrolase family protein [Bacteroidales bacterium]|nr:amidohydrolase family protein [Bacteroidales bacterium]
MDKEPHTILEGIHYRSRRVIRLGMRNGSIYSISEEGGASFSSEKSRSLLPVIAPGLVDLQINGMRGVDFNDPELLPRQVEEVAPLLLEEGVTRFYPTLITGPAGRTSCLIRTLKELRHRDGLAGRMIGGIHLEGPFISREEGPRGAHPEEYCLDPDIPQIERWQEEAEGLIRIITLAPELPGCEALIRACVKLGMVVAIGHTAANTGQILRAVKAGATLSTHLGNGCHPVLPRHPNYIWDQLASETLYVSMIADGFHLPDSVLKVFSGIKKERTILVSDGMSFTGMEPGLYISPSTGAVQLTPAGKLHREGDPGLLAGSAGTLLEGVRKMSFMCGLTRAWEMGSVNPLNLMNLAMGDGLRVGAPADLVLLDGGACSLTINQVYKNGILRSG